MTVTLITGTSKGIGQTTALHLARQGHHVFASMRNPDTGSAALTQAARDEGLKLDVIQLDVNDPKSSEQAVENVLGQTGKIDVLVNNAGIGAGAPIEELPEELLRTIFETNFFGAMRMMRLVLPTMRQALNGAIVNISSISGRLAHPNGSAYSGSKFALEAASECLALEVRRFNIRVVIIEPGFTRTPMVEKGGPRPKLPKLDPNSPYHAFKLRSERLSPTMKPNAQPPELVAEAIQHSLETDEPKLRYPVGEDAKAWAVGRQAMTDEDWVNFGREMTLDEYAKFYHDQFGMEI
jgi:NAD(P)-dependent dehydrogenase (short-subunit alcohol dehydrogenase family)